MDWFLRPILPLPISNAATLALVTGLLVFASVFLLTVTGARALMTRVEIRRRAKSSERIEPSGARDEARFDMPKAAKLLDGIGKYFAPTDVESYSLARKDMVKAGFFTPGAVLTYHATRILLGFGLPLLGLVVLGLFPLGLSANAVLVAVGMLCGLGFVGPSFYVQYRQKKMRTQYRTSFPDFMDLLVVCVESGLALQPAIQRISREIAPSAPHFAINLHLIGLEMRAGSSLGDALDHLSERLDLEEGFSLSSLLKQSEELGTSLSSALRAYSDEMRDKRLTRAETKAQALPVKITLPVGFCIFPVILVILFLPLAIRIRQLLAY